MILIYLEAVFYIVSILSVFCGAMYKLGHEQGYELGYNQGYQAGRNIKSNCP